MINMKSRVLEVIKELKETKLVGLSMALAVNIRNKELKQSLDDLLQEGLITCDNMNRYRLARVVPKPAVIKAPKKVSKPEPEPEPEPEVPYVAVTEPLKNTLNTLKDGFSSSEATSETATLVPEISAIKSDDIEIPVFIKPKTVVQVMPEVESCNDLETVIQRMERRLNMSGVDRYEDKVTVLTRLASSSPAPVRQLLDDIAEDLRERENSHG